MTRNIILELSIFSLAVIFLFFYSLGIHGPVKAFTKHLAPKVHDLFKNSLQPNAPIWRANWAVFNDLEGPLHLFTPDGHDQRNEINQKIEYKGNILSFDDYKLLKVEKL